MYDNITGKIDIRIGYMVIKTMGLGFKVFCTDKDLKEYKDSEELTLYTHLDHTEKGVNLYGFSDILDREIFLSLIKVNSVGCKIALRILSGFSAKEIVNIIRTKDINKLMTIKGIGKQFAIKIVEKVKV